MGDAENRYGDDATVSNTNNTVTTGLLRRARSKNRSWGVVLSCRVRWHMRGGMRVPYHARAPQQREQRSLSGTAAGSHVAC